MLMGKPAKVDVVLCVVCEKIHHSQWDSDKCYSKHMKHYNRMKNYLQVQADKKASFLQKVSNVAHFTDLVNVVNENLIEACLFMNPFLQRSDIWMKKLEFNVHFEEQIPIKYYPPSTPQCDIKRDNAWVGWINLQISNEMNCKFLELFGININSGSSCLGNGAWNVTLFGKDFPEMVDTKCNTIK